MDKVDVAGLTNERLRLILCFSMEFQSVILVHKIFTYNPALTYELVFIQICFPVISVVDLAFSQCD